MAHGIKKNEAHIRTTITLSHSANRRLEELMLLMRLSRSEVLAYLIEREAERRLADISKQRVMRGNVFDLDSISQ